MKGKVHAEQDSVLDLYLAEESVWCGSVQPTAEGEDAVSGAVRVFIDSDSVWVLDADSEVQDLYIDEGGSVSDEEGHRVSIWHDGKRVVYGNSDLKLYVTGEYAEAADLSEMRVPEPFAIDRKAFEESTREEGDHTDPAPVPPEPDGHTVSNGNLAGMIAGTCVLILALITIIIRKK